MTTKREHVRPLSSLGEIVWSRSEAPVGVLHCNGNSVVQFIGKMHQGMLAPMCFKCVLAEARLPIDISR